MQLANCEKLEMFLHGNELNKKRVFTRLFWLWKNTDSSSAGVDHRSMSWTDGGIFSKFFPFFFLCFPFFSSFFLSRSITTSLCLTSDLFSLILGPKLCVESFWVACDKYCSSAYLRVLRCSVRTVRVVLKLSTIKQLTGSTLRFFTERKILSFSFSLSFLAVRGFLRILKKIFYFSSELKQRSRISPSPPFFLLLLLLPASCILTHPPFKTTAYPAAENYWDRKTWIPTW